MTEAKLREIGDHEWEHAVERSSEPVLVMFFSPTCRHCIQMKPYIEELAQEFSPSVSFLMLNILEFGWIAEKYGVMATPTFIWFCGGKPVQSRVGAVFPAMLKKMIEEMIQTGEECRMKSTEIKYEISGYG
ncbi:thioredoxin family protein [Methanospirillum lacunae]|uniref:Thiol reductase thioredoxin n=1 Tax=Methanospirillum lacunae TaxID=668570 RepID=A0A2V2N7Z7_9EURY|nr:thioredoxin family protein [Methanospirillum lacunae]PWR73826.1 thiol reductase thioredoxin [Methanospirillum lacunae]